MDVARPDLRRKRRRRRILLSFAGLLFLLMATVAVSRLDPAPPSVEASSVWIGTVERGRFVIQVSGVGKLVPETVVLIPAASDARVARCFVEPGTQVKAHTVLLETVNPALEQAAVDARFGLAEAEATYRQLEASLQAQLLQQQQAQEALEANYRRARAKADFDQLRLEKGVLAPFDAQQSAAEASALEPQVATGAQGLEKAQRAMREQLAAQKAKVEAQRGLYLLKQDLVDQLRVRAGADGVVQDLPVEVGQWVTAGTILAKVAQVDRLKAEVEVAETDARDIAVGQAAEIDTHNGTIPGHISRIDPAVQNGTVSVEVVPDVPLPPGLRPDLSVDATIRVASLDDAVYIGRPTVARRGSTVQLFKVLPGEAAVQVPVELGQISVDKVQVLRGLQPGERVILSDMSAWSKYARIHLRR